MELKKYKLSNLTNIRFGSNERSDPAGTVAFIMAKNFQDDFSFSLSNLHYIHEEDVKDRALLQPNDILLAGKGNIFAVQWKGEVEPAVASGTFFVLSLKSREVLPEYLIWYLNSAGAQKQFAEHVKTTTVPHMRRGALDEIEIPVPPIEIQKAIVEAGRLMQEAKRLNNELIEQKEKTLDYLLLKH